MEWWSPLLSLSPAAYEELSQNNAERHDWIEEGGAQDRRVKGRSYQRIADYLSATMSLYAKRSTTLVF
jgi:hypothetical protein